MPATIHVSDLCPCDVLLYHGDSAIAHLIQWFSGSEYSHTSIYDGAMVVEAVADGVKKHTVDESVSSTVYVDVWRLKKEGHLIGSPELPVQPVAMISSTG
ncbi:MAG: hypothetical protein HGA81_11135, partial [Chlorobium limicola]|nr:hypothetical protein [Chlorobium limicola]